MRTLFIGGTRRGHMTLQALLEAQAPIVGVISLTQDEHELERYEERIRALVEHHGIPLYQTKWMKDRDYVRLLADDLRPEVALVVGCRILIPPEICTLPPRGTLAVHDSLLPNYRGFAPLNWSIINGENRTGVTLFYLSELMDGGDIVTQKIVCIEPNDTAPMVYERICQATVEVVLEIYPLLVEGKAPRTNQDYTKGSFTCSRVPNDGLIDWSSPSSALHNQVRALTYPYPGAFSYYQGKKLIIWKAHCLDRPPYYVGRIPGRVVGISKSEGYVDVLTGDSVLRILEIQIESSKRTMAANVIKSVRDSLGLQVTDLLDRIQMLEQRLAVLSEANP